LSANATIGISIITASNFFISAIPFLQLKTYHIVMAEL